MTAPDTAPDASPAETGEVTGEAPRQPDQLIFISYARTDDAFARAIAGNLQVQGARVWMDRFDITPGDDWNQKIAEGLGRTTHFLIVLSPESVKSPEVMSELQVALDDGRRVIPILYKPCDIPRRLRLIQYLEYPFGDAHNVKANRQLLAALSIPARVASRRVSRKRLAIWGSQLLFAADVFLLFWLARVSWFNLTPWLELLGSVTGQLVVFGSVAMLVMPNVYRTAKGWLGGRVGYAALFMNEQQELRVWRIGLAAVVAPIFVLLIARTPNPIELTRVMGQPERSNVQGAVLRPHDDTFGTFDDFAVQDNCYYRVETSVGFGNSPMPDTLYIGVDSYGDVVFRELQGVGWPLYDIAHLEGPSSAESRIAIALERDQVVGANVVTIVFEQTMDYSLPDDLELYAYFNDPSRRRAREPIDATGCGADEE